LFNKLNLILYLDVDIHSVSAYSIWSQIPQGIRENKSIIKQLYIIDTLLLFVYKDLGLDDEKNIAFSEALGKNVRQINIKLNNLNTLLRCLTTQYLIAVCSFLTFSTCTLVEKFKNWKNGSE
jgi:hypothetical protein